MSTPVDPYASDSNQDAVDTLATFLKHSDEVAQSGAGYVESVHNVAERSAKLYFKDPTKVPSAVTAEADSVGVSIAYVTWPYSLSDLREGLRLITEAYPESLPDGFVAGFYSLFDGVFPGITVKGSYPDGRSGVPDASVVALLEKVGGVQVQFENSGPLENHTTRTTDTSPFYAGGYMQSVSSPSKTCTSGFAIVIGGSIHTITARHCTLYDYFSFADVGQQDAHYYGVPTASQPTEGDARILSRSGLGFTFSGAYNSSLVGAVTGYHDVSVGDAIDTSGGNSGEHGSISVVAFGTFGDGPGNSLTDAYAAESNGDTGVVSVPGDSGGPVYQRHVDGTIAAIGMQQASATGSGTAVTCGPLNFTNGGTFVCRNNVIFTTMDQIVGSSGATGIAHI